MKKSTTHVPHDKLVRRLLSNTGTARDLLEAYLPAEVTAFIDLDYLERQPDTFVDSRHRMLEVDILFKTRCKGTQEEGYIWFLIEQQREPDVWLPLRQFCYMGIIWDHIRKNTKSKSKRNKLPFIYPLIISNASEPYNHSLTLRDMIEPEEGRQLFDKLFNTPSPLIDLAAIPDEELRTKLQERVRAQALLLSLKHVFDKDLQDYLEKVLFASFQMLDNGKKYAYKVTSYWDPTMKRARQKSVYLGIVEETGTIIPIGQKKIHQESLILDFDDGFCLHQAIKQSSLYEPLMASCKDTLRDVLPLIFYRISTDSALYNCEKWLEGNVLTYLYAGAGLSSQHISRTLAFLGDEAIQRLFFN